MPQRYTREQAWVTSLELGGVELLPSGPVSGRYAGDVLAAAMEPDVVLVDICLDGSRPMLSVSRCSFKGPIIPGFRIIEDGG